MSHFKNTLSFGFKTAAIRCLFSIGTGHMFNYIDILQATIVFLFGMKFTFADGTANALVDLQLFHLPTYSLIICTGKKAIMPRELIDHTVKIILYSFKRLNSKNPS